MLDLQKACDMVDHSIMLYKFKALGFISRAMAIEVYTKRWMLMGNILVQRILAVGSRRGVSLAHFSSNNMKSVCSHN